MPSKTHITLLLIGWMSLLVCTGCSTRLNTRATRAYHELTTRYNVYYNAEKAYHDILEEQLNSFSDDYSLLLPLHPSFADSAKTKLGGPFDPVIAKTEKAIRKHSISAKPRRDPSVPPSPEYRQWLQQKEFNPFIHRAWLLMGKAHAQNGDHEEALAVFNETVNLFGKGSDAAIEARIWSARIYIEMKRMFEAEQAIYALNSIRLPSHLEDLFTKVQTQYLLETGEYAKAVQTTTTQPVIAQTYTDRLKAAEPKDGELPEDHWDFFRNRWVRQAFYRNEEAVQQENKAQKMSDGIAPLFSVEREGDHLLLLLSSDQNIDWEQLLFRVSAFNFTRYQLKTFTLSPIPLSSPQALTVSPFRSFDEASRYAKDLEADSILQDNFSGSVMLVPISATNAASLQRGGTIDSYLSFLSTTYDVAPISLITESTKTEERSEMEMPEIKPSEMEIPKMERNAEKVLPLKPDTLSLPRSPEELKQQLEQKESDALRQLEETGTAKSRKQLLKERERQRKAKIKEREKERKRQQREREVRLKRK